MVDAASILASAPSAIDAVYFMASSTDEERHYAQAVHAAMLEAYGMEDGVPGSPPLLLIDFVGGGSVPFSLPR